MVKTSYQDTPVLETALKALGDIGGKRDECNNYIGACAEPHSARTVMKATPIKASPRLRMNKDLRNGLEDGSRRMLNAL